MALSDREQHLLDEMEQHLYRSEADVVSAPKSPVAAMSARNIVIGVLCVVLGVVGLIWGVASKVMVIGLVGFIVMIVGALFAIRANPSVGTKAKTDTKISSSNGANSSSSATGGASFQDRMQQRWDRRNGDRPE